VSLGEIDTLGLLYEKLENLFEESQGYYETFLDTNNLFKQGKLTEKEFFEKLGDYVVAYSALEFLAIKVIFELKKSIDKLAGGSAPGGTHSPGLMPGMGNMAGMAGRGMGTIPPTAPPTIPGQPPSIVSVKESFSEVGAIPSPDLSLISKSTTSGQKCSACGSSVGSNAKFCTKCGNKLQ